MFLPSGNIQASSEKTTSDQTGWPTTIPARTTLAPLHLHATGSEAGTAANSRSAEQKKVTKYQSLAIYFTFNHCHQDTRIHVTRCQDLLLFELEKETEAADMRAKIHILPPTKNLHAWPFKRGVQWLSWDQYHRKRSWINCLSYIF